MTCDCNNERLVFFIKQGEKKSYRFNISDNNNKPVELNGFNIIVQIKEYPLFKVKSLFEYILTKEYSPNGYISTPEEGEFQLTLDEEVSGKLPPKDYYLIIMLVRDNDTQKIIISGEHNSSGVLKVCKQ